MAQAVPGLRYSRCAIVLFMRRYYHAKVVMDVRLDIHSESTWP